MCDFLLMYSMTWTMLKLLLVYKVWNGLALPHLKVRLTNPMVKLRIQSTDLCCALNSGSIFGFWLLGVHCRAVQKNSIFLHFLYLSFALPLSVRSTPLSWNMDIIPRKTLVCLPHFIPPVANVPILLSMFCLAHSQNAFAVPGVSFNNVCGLLSTR